MISPQNRVQYTHFFIPEAINSLHEAIPSKTIRSLTFLRLKMVVDQFPRTFKWDMHRDYAVKIYNNEKIAFDFDLYLMPNEVDHCVEKLRYLYNIMRETVGKPNRKMSIEITLLGDTVASGTYEAFTFENAFTNLLMGVSLFRMFGPTVTPIHFEIKDVSNE